MILIAEPQPHAQNGAEPSLFEAGQSQRRMVGWVATGAGEGIRTLDPNLGKVVLYP